jgi:hypothetical protein
VWWLEAVRPVFQEELGRLVDKADSVGIQALDH